MRSQRKRLAIYPDFTQCSDPKSYALKLDIRAKETVAAHPKLAQISTVYGQPSDGGVVIPPNTHRHPEWQAVEERTASLAGIQDLQIHKRSRVSSHSGDPTGETEQDGV
jgi:hypothetical protein